MKKCFHPVVLKYKRDIEAFYYIHMYVALLISQMMKKSRQQKGGKYRNMNNNALSEFKTEKPEKPEKPEVRS